MKARGYYYFPVRQKWWLMWSTEVLGGSVFLRSVLGLDCVIFAEVFGGSVWQKCGPEDTVKNTQFVCCWRAQLQSQGYSSKVNSHVSRALATKRGIGNCQEHWG